LSTLGEPAHREQYRARKFLVVLNWERVGNTPFLPAAGPAVASRYIHLNPVRAGLVDRPDQWPWSSYPGYARRSRQLPWVSYDALLGGWQGEWGGSDAAVAYRRYVESGISAPSPSPFREAVGGWVLGSPRFVDRLRTLAGPASGDRPAPE